jgi:hypothetical protein
VIRNIDIPTFVTPIRNFAIKIVLRSSSFESFEFSTLSLLDYINYPHNQDGRI